MVYLSSVGLIGAIVAELNEGVGQAFGTPLPVDLILQKLDSNSTVGRDFIATL